MPLYSSLQRKFPLIGTSRFWLVASMTLVLSACEQNGVQPKITQETPAQQKTLPTQVTTPTAELTTEQQIAARQVFSTPTLKEPSVTETAPKIQLTAAKPETTKTDNQVTVISFNNDDIADSEPAVESKQQDTTTNSTAAVLLAKPYATSEIQESVVSAEPAILVAPVEPPPVLDLWQLTVNSYALPTPEATQAIQKRIAPYDARYRKGTEYMQKVTLRSSRYYHYVLGEVLAAGLPGELALLPFIESGFDTFAYSHGRAAGAWQFIPSTGRMFGLKQTWWYDGRRDIVASTGAAIKYLSQLHKRFDNDWFLAIAAYNGGPGTVSKAIKANKKLGKATDYWSLSLPKETMHYVPKLLGFSQVVRDHAGTDKLTTVANEAHFEIVGIGSQIDLALAAELADISI